jgi:hypothetical protein
MSFPITEHKKIRVKNVRDIVVTDIVSEDGKHIRSIRVLAAVEGSDEPIETLEIVVESDNEKSDVDLTTPVLKF